MTDLARTPRTFADLLALLDATPAWVRQETASGAGAGPGGDGQSAVDPPAKHLETFEDEQIAKALGIDVLGRTPDGEIEVYVEHLARTVMVKNVARLKYEDLLNDFSTPVRRVVSRTNEDSAPGMWPIRDVREALAHLGSLRMIGDETKLGLGCWPCGDDATDAGAPADALIMVNASEAAYLNGSGELHRITHPRHHGHLLSFESGTAPWYDFDRLAGMIRQATEPGWRFGVIDELTRLWERWRWGGKGSPIIVSGLVLATWVQSLWAWRPRIDVLGGSSTGKSMFCSALGGLFRNLAILTSDTSAPGLRQEMQKKMPAVIVDEVDAKDKERAAEQRKILKMLRSASRGTDVIRGTGSQKAMKFRLQHLVWVAGLTLSYDDQADRNRAISLNLLPPLSEMAGKLVLPPSTDLADLGQRTLAVAVWCARRAVGMAVTLKDLKIPGVDARLIESYAVPLSMIVVAQNADEAFARQYLTDALRDTAGETKGESDEENLIAEILRAQVRLGSNTKSVGQAIELVADVRSNSREEWSGALERVGVKLAWFGVSEGIPKELATTNAIIMNHQTVRRELLRNTRWESQPIDQVLRRVPGCRSGRRRVGGVHGRVVMFEHDSFVAAYIGNPDDDKSPAKADL